MHVEEMLDDEVTALAGARYARKDASIGGRRHGSNPGTVGLAGQRVPIRVPRFVVCEIPLPVHAALHGEGAVAADAGAIWDFVPYAAAAEAIPGAIGLSPCPGRPVPRNCTSPRASENVVAIVDGKTFAEATMVIARHHDDGRETLPGLRRPTRRTRRC